MSMQYKGHTIGVKDLKFFVINEMLTLSISKPDKTKRQNFRAPISNLRYCIS